MLPMKGSRCRFNSEGRKLVGVEWEEQVLNWTHEQHANMLRISRKLIMFNTYLFMMKTVERKRSWKMLKAFPSKVKQQIDLSQLTSKLVGYIMHAWRLAMKGNYPSNCMIAMGETAIWSKTVRKTTSNASWGRSKICLWNHRVLKKCESVSGGMKMKPFVVFHCAKREAAALREF